MCRCEAALGMNPPRLPLRVFAWRTLKPAFATTALVRLDPACGGGSFPAPPGAFVPASLPRRRLPLVPGLWLLRPVGLVRRHSPLAKSVLWISTYFARENLDFSIKFDKSLPFAISGVMRMAMKNKKSPARGGAGGGK